MAQFTALTVLLHQEVVAQQLQQQIAARHDPRILELKASRKRYEEALQEWAKANRESEFGEASTLELRQGRIAFRWAPRAVRFLEGWSEELALAKLQKLKGLIKYVRYTSSINKRRILDETKGDENRARLKDLERAGITVMQEEEFKVEAKLDDVPS